ncbi:hypothetical protein EOE67_03960 [Rheinheimera riviphila]|uniref:Uncharacterized protein n=1 Tax=Rheinheimera riviphila TaxID=1834037 RepID=A0A437R1X3_9GAMM|nr:hypothetical protein [Rheinheimera riviphila]RVU40745.1 hypothetical protein EOE67_03960 [Rheinheimera riviphila]
MATSVADDMKRWYCSYITQLTRIAGSRYPALVWLWVLLVGCGGWTGYWLFAEHRGGGELLLPLLLSLWMLIWIFIRLIFVFQPPLLPAGAGWRMKLKFYWFYLKLHGTASLILLLFVGSLLISLKLVGIVWRSFG